MGASFTAIADNHRAFIAEQHVFFVATAPSGAEGHVNLSPKGYDTFTVLGPNEVAYLDLTGSGAETIAHLRDSHRITFLFCSFGEKPLLLRLYGTGEALVPGDDGFAALLGQFPERRGTRAIIRCTIDRVATSCGYSVPEYTFVAERDTLDEWAHRKSDDELDAYRAKKNARSIDGLPALGQTLPS